MPWCRRRARIVSKRIRSRHTGRNLVHVRRDSAKLGQFVFSEETVLASGLFTKVSVQEFKCTLANRFVTGQRRVPRDLEFAIVGFRVAVESSSQNSQVNEIAVSEIAKGQVIAIRVFKRIGELEHGVGIGRDEQGPVHVS